MAPEQNAAPDQDGPARPGQQAISARQSGLLLIGRLRELAPRVYKDRSGKDVESVDAYILCGNTTYRAEVGSPLQAKALTGHSAPWKCDEDQVGDRIELRVEIRAATGPSGAFLSTKAIQP